MPRDYQLSSVTHMALNKIYFIFIFKKEEVKTEQLGRATSKTAALVY